MPFAGDMLIGFGTNVALNTRQLTGEIVHGVVLNISTLRDAPLETFAMALRNPKRFSAFLSTSVENWLHFLSEPLTRKGVSPGVARAFATIVIAGFRGFMLDRAIDLWLRSLDTISPHQENSHVG